MRQLTSLDAQFLAMESAADLRARRRPRDLRPVDRARRRARPSRTSAGWSASGCTCCRRSAGGSRRCRSGSTYPYWVEDPDFDLDFHIRETRRAAAGRRPRARRDRRADLRPPARPRAAAVGALPDPRAARTAASALLTEDPPRRRRRRVGRRDPRASCSTSSPEGREVPPPRATARGERVPGDARDARPRRCSACRASRCARCARSPRTLPHLTDAARRRDACPARAARRGRGACAAALRRRRATASVLERPPRARAAHAASTGRISPHRRFAFGSLPLDRVKALKNALGITVNDVVVALCATAVRDWLLERDELPDEPLVAMVPVSVRTQRAARRRSATGSR